MAFSGPLLRSNSLVLRGRPLPTRQWTLSEAKLVATTESRIPFAEQHLAGLVRIVLLQLEWFISKHLNLYICSFNKYLTRSGKRKHNAQSF